MVAQDHRVLGADVFHQPLALLKVRRDAFILMVGHLVMHQHGCLGDRHQPGGLGGNGLTGLGVDVHDGMGILARHVQGAVDGEASGVGHVGRLDDRMALDIDLDERGGGDLLEHQVVGVDEEVMLRPRHPRREVGEDDVIPAIQRHQPIGGGEIGADRPFLGGNAVLDTLGLELGRHAVISAKIDGRLCGRRAVAATPHSDVFFALARP